MHLKPLDWRNQHGSWVRLHNTIIYIRHPISVIQIKLTAWHINKYSSAWQLRHTLVHCLVIYYSPYNHILQFHIIAHALAYAHHGKVNHLHDSGSELYNDASSTSSLTPTHAELHWLPIKHRIQYKIAVTAFKVLTTQQPSYIANNPNIIRFCAASRQLRSSGRNLLHDDRINLAFAGRAFSHYAPAVWNSLPPDIVSDLSCLATFKRLVKTELYNRAYLRWLVTTRTYDSSLCEWLNVRHQPRNNNNRQSMQMFSGRPKWMATDG